QGGGAAVDLRGGAGFAVEPASFCCGGGMIGKGFLTDARRLAEEGVAKLDRYAAAGVPILGLEPSCILTLADEWPELVPGAAARRVAAVAELADGWLARQASDGKLSLTPPAQPGKAIFHGHCHQQAPDGVNGSASAR